MKRGKVVKEKKKMKRRKRGTLKKGIGGWKR